MTTRHDQDQPTDPPIAEPLRPVAEPAPATEVTTDAVTYSTRTPGPSRLRVGAIAGAAVALAVGVVATSFAATPAPTATGSLTTSGAGAGSAGALAAPVVGDPAVDADGDTFDHGRMGDRAGFRDITIAAISGSSITLKTDDGWTRTVTVTDAVALTKGGQEIAVSDLAVGDQVRIAQTRNDDGSYTVDAVAVVVPSVRGTVSDVSSSGFKVTTRDGSVWTVTVNGSTQYQYGSGDGSLADVTDGTTVIVLGDSTGDNALTALTVRVAPDRAMGTVTSKTADTIVIKLRDGSSVTVHVDGDTTYRVAGVDTADLGDVAVDMVIGVSGRERADGSIDADAVMAGDGRGGMGMDGFGGGRGGFGGGHGFGPGFGPGMDDDSVAPTASPTTSS